VNDRRLLWIVIFVLVLTISNLGATIYFGISRSAQGGVSNPGTDASAEVSEKDAAGLVREIVDLYNENKIHELYLRFDELARVQFTEKKLTDDLFKLNKMTGKVDEFAYVNSEYAGREAGRSYIALNYKARLTGGPFTAGSIRVTVMKKDGRVVLLGFFVNANSSSAQ
jgi:hypothetical protein